MAVKFAKESLAAIGSSPTIKRLIRQDMYHQRLASMEKCLTLSIGF